jgi:hypothetical protein
MAKLNKLIGPPEDAWKLINPGEAVMSVFPAKPGPDATEPDVEVHEDGGEGDCKEDVDSSQNHETVVKTVRR